MDWELILPFKSAIVKAHIVTMCFAGSHPTKKSCNTGETKGKPLAKSRCILKYFMAVYPLLLSRIQSTTALPLLRG
jgi:hypothetical protein